MRKIGSWRINYLRISRICDILLQFSLDYALHHVLIEHLMRNQWRYLLSSTIIEWLSWEFSDRQGLEGNAWSHMVLSYPNRVMLNRRSWGRIQCLDVFIWLLLWGRKLVCKFNHFFGRLIGITILSNRCISHYTSLKIDTVSCWLVAKTSLLDLYCRLMMGICW